MPTAPSTRSSTRSSTSTTRWWVIGILGCALGVLAIAWLQFSGSADRVTFTTVSYRVESPEAVEVRFDVAKASTVAARCEVRALNGRFGVVGSTQVTIPASPEPSTGHTVTVRTTSLAVTGLVHSCDRLP